MFSAPNKILAVEYWYQIFQFPGLEKFVNFLHCDHTPTRSITPPFPLCLVDILPPPLEYETYLNSGTHDNVLRHGSLFPCLLRHRASELLRHRPDNEPRRPTDSGFD
ncbi:hypothetical protein EVAR_11529_1 [Eumeta japonica]|uniref:Uncharacterized protein n=1 Tax=Eumeta variegata TaxID=151549 RepID=A0A4C1TYW6_EUMVA|nr:hypothetical protein EVAR_11529_1 [Eumeta japonica]